MPYTHRKLEESEIELDIFEADKGVYDDAVSVGGHIDPDMLERKVQYEILDEYGDQLIIVTSELEAESLVSHLNRN